MPTVRDIFTKLCGEMPLSGCESWDNSGLLVGSADNEVKKVLVSLDVTLPVVSEAERGRYELVVSHHPVIFRPVPSVTDETPTGLILQKLIKNDISVISMHTNADVACGGVNDLLAEALGLKDVGSLRGGEAGELGRFGELCEQMTLHGFLEHVRASLSPFAGARFVDAGRPVKRVAVGGGACGELLYNAKKTGCDTFLTSDIKYSSMLEAEALGLNLIDAGHFETENVVCPRFAGIIRGAFHGVEVKIADGNVSPVEYFM